MKRVLTITALLLITASVPAAANPLMVKEDSLSTTGLHRLKPRPYSGTNSLSKRENFNFNTIHGNGPGNAGGYHYHGFIRASDHQFYKNLEKISQKWHLTRWLHGMVTRNDAFIITPSEQTRESRNEFLQWEGKIIRDIHFSPVGLFAPGTDEQRHSPGGLERAADFLHFSTRPGTIQKHLLINEGDKIDPFILAESERILRQLPYLEDARIFVFSNTPGSDHADLVVVTKDRWARGFDMDLSDIDKGNLDIYDRNILGMGQELQGRILFDATKENYVGFETTLSVQNIGGSFINTRVNYLDAFDNRSFQFKTGRSFITPSMKYAGGVEFITASLFDDFHFPDTIFLNQDLNYHEYDYWFGRSFMLGGKGRFTGRNIYLTSRFNRYIFFDRPGIHDRARHNYHNRNLFLASMVMTFSGYLKSNFIYEFGPTEDIPVGTAVELTAGYEDNQFYGRLYGGITISHSNYLERLGYINNSISAGTFLNNSIREQGVLKINSSGFSGLKSINKFLFRQFFAIDYTLGIRRFEDELISISNRNGIRGLRSDALAGTTRFTLQSETMFYAKKSWYGFRYAIYGMADLGWIGRGEKLLMPVDFYSGFGLGMRVRNEHLVLPTLQFRFAFFPRVPEQAHAQLFYIMSERNVMPDRFRVSAPEILNYR